MARTIRIQTSRVYEDILKFKDKKVIASEGGSRSTKTTSIIQYPVIESFNSAPFIFRTFREKLTWCKDTVLQDFNEICTRAGIEMIPEFNPRRSDQDYMVNGCLFSFMGVDDIKRVHGLKQDYAFFNEANEISLNVFNQVEQRTTKQILLDWNPSFLVNELIDSVLKRPDCGYIHSTMLDNPFLPETIIKKILSYEPTAENIINGTADEVYWKIYGLGVRAANEGLIYPKYTVIKEMPALQVSYGIDWGFGGDPLALVKYCEYENNVYLDEVIYQSGLLTNELISKFVSESVSKSSLIVADSASPQNIAELQVRGYTIVPAITKDVLWGLNYCKDKQIHVTERSVNLIKELKNYKWKDAKEGDKQQPVKGFDHLLDAFRYRCTYYSTRPQKSTIRISA